MADRRAGSAGERKRDLPPSRDDDKARRGAGRRKSDVRVVGLVAEGVAVAVLERYRSGSGVVSESDEVGVARHYGHRVVAVRRERGGGVGNVWHGLGF